MVVITGRIICGNRCVAQGSYFRLWRVAIGVDTRPLRSHPTRSGTGRRKAPGERHNQSEDHSKTDNEPNRGRSRDASKHDDDGKSIEAKEGKKHPQVGGNSEIL
jgi:hypothetical protein